jgi:hypothetical protein
MRLEPILERELQAAQIALNLAKSNVMMAEHTLQKHQEQMTEAFTLVDEIKAALKYLRSVDAV